MALPPRQVPRRTGQPNRDMGQPPVMQQSNAQPPATPNVGDYSAQQVNMGAQIARPAPGQSQQMRNPNAQGPRYNGTPQQANLGMGSRKNVVPPRQVKPLPPLNQGTRGIAPNPGGMQGSMVPPSLGPAPQMDATDRGIVPPAVSPQTNLGDPTGQLPVPGLLQDMPPRGYGR